MSKVVAWLIAIALVALVVYAIASGLPGDVMSPFRSPNP